MRRNPIREGAKALEPTLEALMRDRPDASTRVGDGYHWLLRTLADAPMRTTDSISSSRSRSEIRTQFSAAARTWAALVSSLQVIDPMAEARGLFVEPVYDQAQVLSGWTPR